MAQKKTSKKPDFEKTLNELEQLVERMENGDLSLETSLQEFEKGMQLSDQCQTLLEEAEQRVQMLCGKTRLKDFDKGSE